MNYPFSTILCPADFDENSLSAVSAAGQIARQNGGIVHVLHIIPTVLAPGEAATAYASQVEEVSQKLQSVAQQHLNGVEHRVHVRIGDTSKGISQTAEEIGADVIVLATHGRTGFPHFLLGSVAGKVVREAPCPVLTIRPPRA